MFIFKASLKDVAPESPIPLSFVRIATERSLKLVMSTLVVDYAYTTNEVWRVQCLSSVLHSAMLLQRLPFGCLWIWKPKALVNWHNFILCLDFWNVYLSGWVHRVLCLLSMPCSKTQHLLLRFDPLWKNALWMQPKFSTTWFFCAHNQDRVSWV